MTLEVLFGAAVILAVVLSLLTKPGSKRQPPIQFFKCARCNTTARHTSRTIEAWRNGKTTFFCQACHAKWLQSRPSQEQVTSFRSRNSGCLGVVALLVLVPVDIALALAHT
ncbi:hypothetical protein ACFWZ3_16565 [Frateuria sp. GZRR35]|uniref:hypothetical protein n=1 Tax=Frateuria sp. GZRR35 TaxID=3351536 RepID=UPI003EDC6FC5